MSSEFWDALESECEPHEPSTPPKSVECEIHGVKVKIACYQGSSMTDEERDQQIEKMINACREMPKEDFLAAIKDSETNDLGGPIYRALLEKLDEIAAKGYVKRFMDDFPPIAAIKLA